MRDRFITWGTRDGERQLFTFELEAEDAKIIRRAIPPQGSTEDVFQMILTGWDQRNVITYPEGTTKDVTGLTAVGSMVPDGVEVEELLRVASAERDWPFEVVSVRLRKQFQGELEELRDVIAGLEKFDEVIFERLKGAWAKVQSELTNKVLRYEHTHGLKTLSDELFKEMKRLRRGKDREVRSASKDVRRDLRAKLSDAEERLSAKQDLRKLFKDLQQIQAEINKAKLAGEDRRALRKAVDQLFKATKAEIAATGADAGILSEQRQRLEHRLKGLRGAIQRMRYSVERDNKDMFYENRRVENAGNQLAEQLGAAKLAMLDQRAGGKQAKLDDMLATEQELAGKLDKLIKREEKAQAKKDARAAELANAQPVASSDGKPRAKKRRRERSLVPRQLIHDIVAVASLYREGAPVAKPTPAPKQGKRRQQDKPQQESKTQQQSNDPAKQSAKAPTQGVDGKPPRNKRRRQRPLVPRQLIKDVAAVLNL